MTDRAILVHVDLGQPVLAGRLWVRSRHGREGATLEYDRAWLAHRARFALEPALALGPGPFHTTAGQPLFGAISDSAPDRWGRILMRRANRGRTLSEADYLLLVDDQARLGALRFSEKEGGPFLAPSGRRRIPPFVELPKLLAASSRVAAERDTEEDLRCLLAPGSSLGGARPKATVSDRDGALLIAKFPREADEYPVVLWEAATLDLAARAGIAVPRWRLEKVAGKPVLLLARFDRDGPRRIPFLSAMAMLGAGDHQTRSYMEIADALRQHGASPREDLRQLWRRIVFSVMVANLDDHLRNHGFLFPGGPGWRLSPAYDLNPVPADIKPRVLSTLIDENSGEASLELAMEVCAYFGMQATEARTVAGQVRRAVSRWREAAVRAGLGKADIDRMASAFEPRRALARAG
jgi:serine/threonine-protein kinase HipA